MIFDYVPVSVHTNMHTASTDFSRSCTNTDKSQLDDEELR